MSHPSQQDNKIALVLAGGGLTGAVYELGALRAIDDLLAERSVNDFDIYVGTSAGSVVAAGLVNGLTPQEMLQALEGSHPLLPEIMRRDLFRFNTPATIRRLRKLPRTLFNTVSHYVKNPKDLNLYDLGWELSNTLPSALYDGEALEGYMRRMLSSAETTNDFLELEKELYIIATSLENGRRVVFGDEQHQNTPISVAVSASSAVPILYKPLRIDGTDYLDGGLRGNASLDLAIERGAKLVVCVNAMVPFDNTPNLLEKAGAHLSDKGMQVVINQVFRILLHSGLHYHVKQLRRRHPDVDIILIEPRRDDETMLFANVMRYSNRLRIAQHGYESVTLDLAEDYYYYKSVLARHGVVIDRKTVGSKLERIIKSGADEEIVEDVLAYSPSDDPTGAVGALRGMLHDLENALGLSV